MKRYLVILEPSETGFSAYVPDLPGCISTGRTRAAVERNIREAIELHIESLHAHGEPVPPPQSSAVVIDVDVRRSA